MVREVESSSDDALLINLNGTTLHFTQKEFTLISGLNCTTDEFEFEFDMDVPNRLISQYFGGDNTMTVSKVEFVKKFEKKVWGNNDDDALKFALLCGCMNVVPMFILRLQPRNIVLTPRELSILELPPPFVESHSVYSVDNEVDQSNDDFMDVQPQIPTAKGKEKVGNSSSPVKDKTKQQTAASPHSIRRQHYHVVKPDVKDEFDNIRKLINEKFSSVMDAASVGHEAEKGSKYQTPGRMPEHTAHVQTHIDDNHIEDLNMPPSQFEFPDELLPSLNPERSIIVHPYVNIQEEVTSLPMQRYRPPGRWNTSPYLSRFGSSTGSSSRIPLTFTKRHPFEENSINGPYDITLIEEYLKWIRDDLLVRSAGHDVAVKHEIEKLLQLLLIYLSTTDFYQKKGTTSSTHSRYNIQAPSDAFEVMYVDNIPQQKIGKFLSCGEGIPNSSIDIEFLSNRYASILWDYEMKKIEVDSMSDDEAPPRKIIPIIDSSSSYRIVLS
ncbi:hypothetical protein HAX54_012106 [Datura stramonium]|uniref:DUF1985 domain-containing protein n=1 Tax=Datura stramonium TaxID=4076 RepID=A0ABS8RK18_DATST|nr:hypothetical protein [Datura stramonium]